MSGAEISDPRPTTSTVHICTAVAWRVHAGAAVTLRHSSPECPHGECFVSVHLSFGSKPHPRWQR